MQATRMLRQLLVKKVHFGQKRGISKKRQKIYEYPQATLNDMPNPEGDFYTLNNARQRSNNMQLVLGIGSLAFSIAFGFATNMFDSHSDIPEPAEIDCYK